MRRAIAVPPRGSKFSGASVGHSAEGVAWVMGADHDAAIDTPLPDTTKKEYVLGSASRKILVYRQAIRVSRFWAVGCDG